MKLVSYDATEGSRAGILVGDDVFDISAAMGEAGDGPAGPAAGTVRSLLEAYGDRLEQLSDMLLRVVERGDVTAIGDLSTVRLRPPIGDPAKVLCIGLNYLDHVAETGRKLPEHPDVFSKFATSLVGPSDDLDLTSVTHHLDFEGELAVVIGQSCRSVPEDEALKKVAGYMVLNDITARDLQYNGSQWLPGKAVDSSTPCGPALVTRDELSDPQNLDIATWVNGVQVQGSNTRHMIFPIAKVISYISHFLALNPGDIISTGTPNGIGAKRQPPMWLQPGDVVEVEIAGVGLLTNRVV